MPINFGDLRRSPQLEWALLACRNMTRIFNEATKFQSSDKFMFTHDTVAKQASEIHLFSITIFRDSDSILLFLLS